MSLSRKFVILLVGSVTSIALLNIFAFYFLYGFYIKFYLSEKIQTRENITIEYINNLIEKQTLEDLDEVFSNTELEFFELLNQNNGSIALENEKNVNIVVDFLLKSGVTPKYIQEVIPDNTLEKILELLKNPESPESRFVSRLLFSLVLINIFFLSSLALVVLYFTRKIILPIQKATSQIQDISFSQIQKKIEYPRKDEIGLLIHSINELNKRLSLQESIRNRLLADISHELKTPITSIQCYLEGISDGVIELSAQNLEAIISEMQRLVTLVNKIMEFEKFDAEELQVLKISQSPYDIISQVAQTQELYLAEKKQKIALSGSKNIEILLDKDLFVQLCYNLIGNFLKYAGADTTLIITIHTKKIEFRDNGNGIARKEIPFLSEKFYQGKIEKT